MIEKLFQATSTINTQPLTDIGNATNKIITIGAGILSGIVALILIITIIYQVSKNSGAEVQQRKENNKKVVYGILAIVFIAVGWSIYGIVQKSIEASQKVTPVSSSLLTTLTINTPALLNVTLPVTNVAIL